MKFTLSGLQRAAGAAGYKGESSDPNILRSYLADQVKAGAFSFTSGGRAVSESDLRPVSVIDVEGEEIVERAAPAAPQSPPDPDIESRIKTMVDEQVRAAIQRSAPAQNAPPPLGAPDGGPSGTDWTKPLVIRSAEEVCFDLRKNSGRNMFDTFERAAAFGDALVHELRNSKFINVPADMAKQAQKRLIARGVLDNDGLTTRAYQTYPVASGGALTSAAFMPDLVKLVSKYGIARRLARVIPMMQAKTYRPKSTGNLTVSYPGENVQASQSQVSYSQLTLEAKEGIVLAQVSKALMADSVIDIAQDVAEDMTRAIALVEDQAYLLGTGTTAYIPGVYGINAKLGSAGKVTGASTQSGHTLPNINSLMGLLPDYAREGAVFLTSPAGQARIFDRLAGAVGGLTVAELQGFGYVNLFLRHPVLVSPVMNGTDDASSGTVDVLFGNFSRGTMFGDRMQLELAIDESNAFKENAVVIRGVVRHDINVHDVGDASVAGPIVGLTQS